MTRRLLTESHAHLGMLGEALLTPDVSDAPTIEAVLDRARAHARQHSGDWVVLRGLRVESLHTPRWPTRDEIDSIATDRPVMLLSFDHHSCASNNAARVAAGLPDNAPDPSGGVIVRDARGIPTGVLLESACMMVRQAMPTGDARAHESLLLAALDHLASLGFARVDDLLAPPWMMPTLARLHDAGNLSTPVELFSPLDSLHEQHANAGMFSRPGMVTLRGGKIFVDGTLNARTAWTLTPFAQPLPHHPCGTPLLSTIQIAHALRTCDALKLDLAAHAIGDGAVRACLDAAEATGLGHRLRIEHLEIVHEQDVPRFASLGVTASVQPCHLLYDVEVLGRQLPWALDGRTGSRVLPLKDLLSSGLTPGQSLLFGSDVPIVRAHPQDSVLAATQRRRTGEPACAGPATDALLPEQALDESTAWRCFHRG